MLTIIVISVISLILVFSELKPRYEQEKKVFWVYAGFLGAAFVLWVLYGLGVRLPSLADPIKGAVTAVFGI